MMTLRKLRNFLLSVLALLLIVITVLTVLVETPSGSRWLITRLAHSAGIHVGDIRGNLREGLDITELSYVEQDQEYRAENVSFRWRPVALLYGAVSIQSFRATTVVIHLPPAAPQADDKMPFTEWPHLGLPLRIEVGELKIANIRYQQGETHDEWKYVKGSISLGTFHLRYHNLTVAHALYKLKLTGKTDLHFPYQTEATFHWTMKLAYGDDGTTQSTPVPLEHAGVSELRGDLLKLHAHTTTKAPVILVADAEVSLVDPQNNALKNIPTLELAVEWQAQTLPPQWWVPQQAQPITSGKLTAKGNWQNYAAELTGDIKLPEAPLLAVSAKANGSLQNIDVQQLLIRELRLPDPATDPATLDTTAKPQSLALSGYVQWLPHLEWKVNAAAEQLNIASLFTDWPSNINARFATTGAVNNETWRGTIDELQLSGNLRGLNLEGGGSLHFDGKAVRSQALTLILGANQIHINGEVSDKVNLAWDLQAPLLGQIDGSITGSVVSKGQVRGTWKLPQVNVELKADQFAWDQYAVEQLQLALSPKASATTAVDGAANSQIATENTGVTAALPTDMNASGSIANAQLPDTDALLAQLYELTFAAKQLRIGANRFSQVTLGGDGSINQHSIQSVIKSARFGKSEFSIAGRYSDKTWEGEFTQLAIKLKKVPRWWLTSSKKIRVASGSVEVDGICLTTRSNLTAVIERNTAAQDEKMTAAWLPQQSPAKLQYEWLVNTLPLPSTKVDTFPMPQFCLDGRWSSEQGLTSHVVLDAVPLRQFYALFKTEVYFAGVMDGVFNLTTKNFSLQDLAADMRIGTRGAELRYQFAGGNTEVYPWRNLGINATLAAGELNASAGMEWLGYGTMNADAQLNLQTQKINRGKFLASFTNLAPLETLLVFANDVKGDLQADLSMGGSFTQPYLLGDVQLRNGSANLPKLGVDLKNMQLLINSTQAGNINVVSEVESGDGKLTVVGDLTNFGNDQWSMTGVVKGNDFKVISLPQLKATLSPNIRLDATKKVMRLTGDALIPWARANIKTLPQSATQVSNDVVVVDDKFTEQNPEAGAQVYANINLALGDDVRFKGFGLDSQLSGKLNLFKDLQRQLLTTGFVSVKQGSYKAYSQTLTIERGRLIFQGDYENPGLDIRASRKIEDTDDITVGLEIDGTLQRPSAKVFSVPSQGDSQAMMMLLTGKSGQDASNAGALLLLSAAGGVGGDSSDGISSSISRFFRVDELEVKSDKGIDQSELWVGKYITPKLLVRYVVGVFEQAFSFGVVYQLTDELRIEAVSGEEKSVDMIYKIER